MDNLNACCNYTLQVASTCMMSGSRTTSCCDGRSIRLAVMGRNQNSSVPDHGVSTWTSSIQRCLLTVFAVHALDLSTMTSWPRCMMNNFASFSKSCCLHVYTRRSHPSGLLFDRVSVPCCETFDSSPRACVSSLQSSGCGLHRQYHCR